MKHAVSLLALVALLSATTTSASASAQEQRTVAGRVVRPIADSVDRKELSAKAADSLNVSPIRNAMVTLHRVGKDASGPIDSMRTDAKGHYRFSFRTSGSPDAVYFASVTWGGIAYFTAPLRNASAQNGEGEITVFDTTSRAFPLTVRGRHFIVSAADSTEQRTVVEVFELSNDQIQTLVTSNAKDATPTWSVAVPREARNVKVGQGEISPDAFSHAAGRVSLFSAVAPGMKQLSFSYKLPVGSFPLPVTVEHGAVVLEVLVEEPRGNVVGAGLAPVDPVSLENRNFRRFLAQDVRNGDVITINLAAGPTVGRTVYIAALLAALGVAMLFMLMRAMQRRRPISYEVPTVSRTPDIPLADRLAREIAALDATFARHEAPNDMLRSAYDQRRAELKDALSVELSRQTVAR